MLLKTIFIIVVGVLVHMLVLCNVNRLSNNVRPIHYFLTMETHLGGSHVWKEFPYNGSVTIEIKILEDSNYITLHKKKIAINSSTIAVSSLRGELVKLKSVLADNRKETYTIELESKLLKNRKYNLTIGSFNRSLSTVEGFFKAVYWTNNNQERIYAATNFASTAARKAFPCFDEPSMKAQFTISLIRRKEYHSLSNTELDNTEDLGDGRFKDTFKTTPVMAVHNVAFAVSDLKATERVDRLRFFATPEQINLAQVDQALETSVKMMRILEDYTGINFTLSKLDQLAAPPGNLYRSGIGNWGLVLYDGSQLLPSNVSSAKDYQGSVFSIAHEMASQWFGNLVTPEWWDYLWLSESFATYFQYYTAGVIYPTWRTMDQFVVDKVQAGLTSEEKESAQPLNFPVEYDWQLPPSHILYKKGPAIVRMTKHFLTPKVFRNGLQKYLKNNEFGVTIPSDLYKALQEAADESGIDDLLQNFTVEEILETWTNSKGFPVVTVNRDYTTGFVTLQQSSRFDKNTTSTKWIIPINYAFSAADELNFAKTTADYWLTRKSITVNNNFSTEGWLIINKQQTGYYRVNYDLENWERLIKFLNSANFKSIPPVNRAQLINDAFNLASRQELPWNIPLRLCEYLVRERDYVPIAAFEQSLRDYVLIYEDNRDTERNFRYFKNYLLTSVFNRNRHDTEYQVYKKYLQNVMSGIRNDLGFEPKPTDDHLKKLLREVFSKFYRILS